MLYMEVPKEFKWMLPVNLVLDFLNFYLVYSILIPAFSKLKPRIMGFLYALPILILFCGFRLVVCYYYNLYVLEIPKEKMVFTSWVYASEIRGTLIFGIYALLIRLSINWVQTQKQKLELMKQNKDSELAMLRSQVNPHFLFNTLNNIYSLVSRKSDHAAGAVMKLSSIMRYMLYDANHQTVPLEKELEYIQSYIDLQQLRIKKKDFIEFNIQGDHRHRDIAPMLLIPFVENAFKHGNKKAGTPGIIIYFDADNNKIQFSITNYVYNDDSIIKDEAGGIGLKNVKRRLELLYPDKYTLDITQKDKMFKVSLEIIN